MLVKNNNYMGKWARINHLKGWVYLNPFKDFIIIKIIKLNSIVSSCPNVKV